MNNFEIGQKVEHLGSVYTVAATGEHEVTLSFEGKSGETREWVVDTIQHTVRPLARALRHHASALLEVAWEIGGDSSEFPGLTRRVIELAEQAERAEVATAVKGLSA